MPRDIRIERFRNIGIMAHIDAGKTTVTERVLFYTGLIPRPGEVHEGSTKMDHTPEETDRGITITSAAVTTYWAPHFGTHAGVRHRINVIDTPGHVDFTIEVERSLRVLDGAVAVLDGGNGVESQTETVWRQADRYGVPRVVFVNKMDKLGADFAMCVASLRERLGVVPVPVQLPLGEEAAHRGVIDLIRMHAVAFDDATRGRTYTVGPVPDEHRAAADRARAALVEACADADPEVMQKYLNGQTADVTADDLERALRAGTIARRFVPVLCGSAYRDKGVQLLLDAVVAYLPSPADIPPAQGRHPDTGVETARPARDDAPFAALAFKLVSLKDVGTLTLLRVYSGRVESGAKVRNTTRGTSERLGQLRLVYADELLPLEDAYAGVIVAALGLRDVRTGDTLCDPSAPVVLESMVFPEPVVELSVEPRSSADRDRLATGLARLALEDPSFRVVTNSETGQTLLRGMGELHLEIVMSKLKREFRVEANTGRPEVAYRETVAGAAEVDYVFKRMTGGPGLFAHVVIAVEPGERGSGLTFVDDVRGGVIPRELVTATERGVRGAMSRGVLAGYPVVDVRVRLFDGSTHAVDSKPMAFEFAGSLAFQDAARKAGLRLLEPVMVVEIVTPEECLGDVIGDLSARRGQITERVARDAAQWLQASVPLRALFGYVTHLRGLTRGRGDAMMRFSHYDAVPRGIEQEVVAKANGA
jgi:elongation factor G